MIAPDRSMHAAVGRRLEDEVDALDQAMLHAVAGTPTPTIDVAATWLARASNNSMLSIAISGVLTATGGRQGRRAAARGLVAVGATSIVSNLLVKPLFHRARPTRFKVTPGRSARMPFSHSFPSGHTASAFAFAAGVSADVPRLALPLYTLATAVGYSRVHMGVHYPSDVLAGAVLGMAIGTAVRQTSVRVGPLSRL